MCIGIDRSGYLRLKTSYDLQRPIVAAFDGFAPHIAILDSAGNIVHVDAAWRQFAVENDCHDPKAYVGQNYLDIVRRSDGLAMSLPREALEGIAAVLSGEQQRFSQIYPCHAPGVERWFVMTATRVSQGGDSSSPMMP